MDIGIYTTEDVLEHKRTVSYGICYWEFASHPKALQGDKFFFAVGGKWQGYFIIRSVWPEEVDFLSESWHELIEKPERKPFQGFTYKVPIHPIAK